MQVVLMMFRGDNEHRSFSITRDVTVIGRREDCDFRIPLGEISRKHCRLIKEGDVLHAEDLGSSNGTFINGERIQSGDLNPGDTLQVGSVTFVVQIDGKPDEEDMRPVLAGDRAMLTGPDDSQAANASGTMPVSHHDEPSSEEAGEFDPMSILESEASDALPPLDLDDSAAGEQIEA